MPGKRARGASLGAFAPFRDTPPPEFPPRLVPVWGTLLDAATRGMETYDSAGRPADGREESKELEDRARRLLGTTPLNLDDEERYSDFANELAGEWEAFELEYSGAAAEREERLRAAREALEEAKPKGFTEKLGETAEKAMDTAQMIALAVVVWALYKSFAAGPKK